MAGNTRFEFTNNEIDYIAEVIGTRFVTHPLSTPLFMLRIMDNNDEIVGCITFTQSLLQRLAWQNSNNDTFDLEQKIIYSISLLNKLPFDTAKLKELYAQQGCLCFEYHYTFEEEGFSADGKRYNIHVNENFEKTGQEVLFGKEVRDRDVKRAILTSLFNHWKNDQETHLPLKLLHTMIPVNIKILVRNIKDLAEDDKKIIPLYDSTERKNVISVRIGINGRKELENELESKAPSGVNYYHMGDNISASSSGDNSPVFVKAHDITLVYNLLDKLASEIEDKYEGEDKAVLIQDVKEIRELSTKPENKQLITEKLGVILTKTAQVAAITNVVIQVIKMLAGS